MRFPIKNNDFREQKYSISHFGQEFSLPLRVRVQVS
jgi:hypothetical protein